MINMMRTNETKINRKMLCVRGRTINSMGNCMIILNIDFDRDINMPSNRTCSIKNETTTQIL